MKPTGESDTKGPPWYLSTRYRIAVVCFFGLFNTFLQRGDLSMAIVCMVNHTAVDILTSREENPDVRSVLYTVSNTTTDWTPNYTFILDTRDELTDSDSVHEDSQASCRPVNATKHEDGELVWDKEIQGLVLGAMYWGYTLLQFGVSLIIRRLGPKLMVILGMMSMSVLTLLSPLSARFSPWALLAVRVLFGMFNGFTLPGLFAIWGKWAPPKERSRLVAISFSGNMAATAAVFPISALLCKVDFDSGWPLIFYVYGSLGVIWTGVWVYCVYDDPADHPRIHPEEKQYLKTELTGATTRLKSVPVPWCKVFTSLPYLSIMCAHFTYNWGLFLLMSNLPIYMMEVMQFDIKSNGTNSLIPYLVMVVFIVLGSLSADALIGRSLLSVAKTRKLMTILGHLLPAVFLLALSYLDCTQSRGAVALLSLGVGFGGFAYSGILVNYYDIAPLFAAQIMSVANAVSAVPGIVTPYVVAEVTKDKTREQWQIVFFLTAALLAFGTIMHVVFGQGHPQSWAFLPEPEEEMTSLPTSNGVEKPVRV